MPIPGLGLAGKLLTYGGTGLLIDDLTGNNLQRILMGTPEAQRNYKVDADGNFQRQVPKKIESKPQKRNFLEQFLFGIPEAERKYTINDAYEYEARTPTPVTAPPPETNLSTSPVSQLSPQDRAYAKERARVEAMIKANPDMKKQDIAAARAKVRDQGLAEWAKANPELAKNVRPGQVGYEIARDVAYPMPTSLADSSTPDLGYNINLQFDPSSATEQTYTNPKLYQLQEYPQGQGAAPFQVESFLTPEVVKQLRSSLLRQQGRL